MPFFSRLQAINLRLFVWPFHIERSHLRAVITLDAGVIHPAGRLLALQAVALGVIFTALVVHIYLSFWFLDFFLTVLSIKSIELIIAKDGIVNLFIGIVRESFFYLGDCQIQLD